MFLPSYNEIPSGWSNDMYRMADTVQTPALDNAFSTTISGYVRSQASPASLNVRSDSSSELTIPAGKWCAVGVAVAFDSSKREVFGVSIAAHMKSTGLAVMAPFVGTLFSSDLVNMPNGLTPNILFRTLLPSSPYGVGGLQGANYRGHVRTVFAGNRDMLVFGVAMYANHATADVVVSGFQGTFDVNRFDMPDHNLFRPVQ